MNFFSSSNNYAGKEEVLNSAERLMNANGQTTTLEVKIELRRFGFIAFQADVSYFMALLAEEWGWDYTSNGRNRVYRLAPATPNWWGQIMQVCPN